MIYVVIHFCNSMWSFLVDAIHRRFSHPLIIHVLYYSWRTSYQVLVAIPLVGLTPSYLCDCFKPGSGVSNVICHAPQILVFSELRLDVVGCLAKNEDHHSLNFPFIMILIILQLLLFI